MDPVETRVLQRILPTPEEEARLHEVVHELQETLSEGIAARGGLGESLRRGIGRPS